MENCTFKVIENENNPKFVEMEKGVTFDVFDVYTLIYEGKVYNKDTKGFETIKSVVRENNKLNERKLKVASLQRKDVDEETLKELFPKESSPFASETDIVCKDFKMEYVADSDDIKNLFSRWSFSRLFLADEIVTIKTEENSYSCCVSDIKTLDRYSGKKYGYKFEIEVKKNIIYLISYQCYLMVSSSEITRNNQVDMISMNMDEGLSYLFKDINIKTKTSSTFKNATTGPIGEYEFIKLNDNVVDKVVEIIQEYWYEKYGVKPECVKLKVPIDTLRSFNFNPVCNVLYNYKSFFNTRFRKYFKRDENTNHFEELCNLVGIPYDIRLLDIAANNSNDLFLAKCLCDAGIKNIENIKSVIHTLHTYWQDKLVRQYNDFWTGSITSGFVDKFYGENTDYLYRKLYVGTKNGLEDLCTYIKTAIPYTSEDEFVAMFNRSFIANNKYWRRSLHQVATLIELNDYSRELMRKACSYGLNKIQSDNIDLAYDKAITKNKFINYAADEMEAECTISKCVFKFPLESYENSSLMESFTKDSDQIAQESLNIARKRYNIIYVKDKGGDVVGYLKYRGIFLLEAKFLKGTTKVSKDEARIACIEWCDRFGIKQYRCNDLKAKETACFSF